MTLQYETGKSTDRDRHAGRDVVDTKDVMLLVRRNDALKELLQSALEDIKK